MSKTTRQYLADVKRRLEISSNYALAKRLEVSEQAIAHLTAGRNVMSTTTAAKVAEILELEPMQVIADCELERGSSPELWKRIRNAAALAGAVIAGAVLYQVLAAGHAPGSFDIAAFLLGFPMSATSVADLTGIHIVQLLILAGVAVLTAIATLALERAPMIRRSSFPPYKPL